MITMNETVLTVKDIAEGVVVNRNLEDILAIIIGMIAMVLIIYAVKGIKILVKKIKERKPKNAPVSNQPGFFPQQNEFDAYPPREAQRPQPMQQQYQQPIRNEYPQQPIRQQQPYDYQPPQQPQRPQPNYQEQFRPSVQPPPQYTGQQYNPPNLREEVPDPNFYPKETVERSKLPKQEEFDDLMRDFHQ